MNGDSTNLNPVFLSEDQAERLAAIFREQGCLRMNEEVGECGRCSCSTRYYLSPPAAAEDKWIGIDGLTHWYMDHTLEYNMVAFEWWKQIQENYETLQKLLRAKL